MNRFNFAVAALAWAGFASVGCGIAASDDAPSLPYASNSSDYTGIKPDMARPYERLYFDVTNHLDVNGDVLAAVDLEVGAKVQVEAVTSDGSPIRFEIWRAHEGGHVELMNAFHVESGFVLTTIEAPSDGRTFLHFPEPKTATAVVVHLGCQRDSGRCTAGMQPGEGCFGGRACDEGLSCIPVDGTCDPTWRGGTCQAPTKDVACDGEAPVVVCGCDGLTYANACLARLTGNGVSAPGPCADKVVPITQPVR